MEKKRILFISAIDFKKKSIQVIRKTPEAYAKSGWEVDYIVARDNSLRGNYFYEDEFDPEEVIVQRIYWPFNKIRSENKIGLISKIFEKLASFLVIFNLFFFAIKKVKNKKYDVLYGYEYHGVLALAILKFFGYTKKSKIVSRFQGSFLNEILEQKKILKIIVNFDQVLAMRAYADLIIMTNDGTKGDLALKKIRGKSCDNIRFWINGVDSNIDNRDSSDFQTLSVAPNFISVSRLVSWKRVERCLKVVSEIKKNGISNVVYNIIGDGEERAYLEELAISLGIQREVRFHGAVDHSSINSYLSEATFFLSMYDHSNVGNPLLEAIKAKKIIVTLNNGDTNRWIKHKKNGLIYNANSDYYTQCAKDIISIIDNPGMATMYKENLLKLEKEKLWDWSERMFAETSEVAKICR